MGTHRAPALQEPAVKSLKSLLFCSVAVAASLPAFACYTVYDGANRIAYQGERAPVDMSLPLHEAMQASYPGGQLVFDLDASCPAIVTGRLAPARTASPLLTDQRTARALHVPFTTVGSNIALVQPGDARMEPGVTVVPTENFAAARPTTGTVITEMRNPPMTVVQRDGEIVGQLDR